MHSGYYRKLDYTVENKRMKISDADIFYIMNALNIFSEDSLETGKFLHGYCYKFACALNEAFGYDIYSIWSGTDSLIHAFCVDKSGKTELFIDVRGITDDWKEFIEEFRSELSEKSEYKVFHSKTLDDFKDLCVKKGMYYKDIYGFIDKDLKKIISSSAFYKEYDTGRFIKSLKECNYEYQR